MSKFQTIYTVFHINGRLFAAAPQTLAAKYSIDACLKLRTHQFFITFSGANITNEYSHPHDSRYSSNHAENNDDVSDELLVQVILTLLDTIAIFCIGRTRVTALCSALVPVRMAESLIGDASSATIFCVNCGSALLPDALIKVEVEALAVGVVEIECACREVEGVIRGARKTQGNEADV
jgi:hypothetical protein